MEPKDETSKYITGIIIIAIIIVAMSFFGGSKNQTGKSDENSTQKISKEDESLALPANETKNQETKITPVVGPTTTVVPASKMKPVDIVYTDENGFTPDHVTIKVGNTVNFINKSTGEMWVGSADHPTHTKYAGTSLREHCPDTSGTAFDQCGTGAEYSFTFTKTGTWGYHDHKNPRMWGVVTVEK